MLSLLFAFVAALFIGVGTKSWLIGIGTFFALLALNTMRYEK